MSKPRRQRSTRDIIKEGDVFISQLLKRAAATKVAPPTGDQSGEPGPPPVEVSIAEQVAVLTAVTRWVQTKHKIDPDADDGDFITNAQRKLRGETNGNGRATRHRAGSSPAKNTGGSGQFGSPPAETE